jgi:signal peptidase II
MYANHVLSHFDRARRIPMALILGGTLGNLVDRVRTGRVTDFIDMGIGASRWPTYNVADIAVVVGAVALAVRLVFEMVLEKQAAVEVPAGESADAR